MAHLEQSSGPRVFATWTIPVAIALLEGLTHFGILYGDSNGYVSIVKLFRGVASVEESQVIHWHGIVRPVVPTLALPLSYLMSYRDAVASVNLGFLVLGTFFAYLFTKRLLNSQAGFVSAVCFATAFPSLLFGTAVLTDGPAYAMEIIVLYYLLFVLEEKRDLRTSLLAGLLIAIAVLTKETSLIIILTFLFLRYLLHKDKLTLSNLLVVATLGILLPLVWSQLVGYNYLGFYGEGLAYHTPGYKGPLVQPWLFALSILKAFGFSLPFAFMGFFRVEDDRFKTLCQILLSVGVLLALWPTAPEYRFTFLAFPAVLPLAASGMDQASDVLARRSWFNRLGKMSWLILFLFVTVVVPNVVAFGGYFRTPFG